VQLVERLGAGLDRAAARHQQGAQLTHHATAILGDGGRLAGQHGPRGVLGVDWIALAEAAAPGSVGPVDLPDPHAVVGEQPGQGVAVAARAFNAWLGLG
jgi:hypothetical protein